MQLKTSIHSCSIQNKGERSVATRQSLLNGQEFGSPGLDRISRDPAYELRWDLKLKIIGISVLMRHLTKHEFLDLQ